MAFRNPVDPVACKNDLHGALNGRGSMDLGAVGGGRRETPSSHCATFQSMWTLKSIVRRSVRTGFAVVTRSEAFLES
jgi:hypothetical protein